MIQTLGVVMLCNIVHDLNKRIIYYAVFFEDYEIAIRFIEIITKENPIVKRFHHHLFHN
jgi:hypothetical protein